MTNWGKKPWIRSPFNYTQTCLLLSRITFEIYKRKSPQISDRSCIWTRKSLVPQTKKNCRIK
jgi:hypothetical protein